MKIKSLSTLILLLFLFIYGNTQSIHQTETHHSKDGKYSWKSVTDDPLNARIYTLDNGLKVYLTVNKTEPRIQTCIPVKAGSKHDPADATGLAHYLEHMLFKGTDQFGALNYKKEKKYLADIEELYEKYGSTTDPDERKKIYEEIDQVSGEAAKYAIANEYDKMLAATGASGTNAYTSFEQTVYINEIPSNQLEKWLMIEAERFRNPVFRLFHTELEAVYEEKNISLDNDGREVSVKVFEGLFKNHNYGLQTTIGTIAHLKNPSLKKIKAYFNQNYVPNNMAICLSGDFDPDKTIRLIDKHFGYMVAKDVPKYTYEPEVEMIDPIREEVIGPGAERVMIGFRFPGVHHRDSKIMRMIDMLLSNSKAGLIDINLVQKQKVLDAGSYPYLLNDYSVHILNGKPREGQDMEEVMQLIFGEIEKIKRGEFSDQLLTAILVNLEVSQMKSLEANWRRVSPLVSAFTSNLSWEEKVKDLEDLKQIRREEIMEVAEKYYKENYVIVFKRTGDRTKKQKVIKPEITPVETNREEVSSFVQNIIDFPVGEIQPLFLDYQEDIDFTKMESGLSVEYIKNTENSLFSLTYMIELGTKHNDKLALALDYLPFLGTDKYTPEQIQKNFYEMGCSFRVSSTRDYVYIDLSGLASKMEKGVELFEHLLHHAKANKEALTNMINDEVKSRANTKLSKRSILWSGMRNYGTYGSSNPFNTVISNDDLKLIEGKELTDILHQLTNYNHKIFYYGPSEQHEVVKALNRQHEVPESFLPAPESKEYAYADQNKTKVYFVEYDMVQAEVLWVTKSKAYDAKIEPIARLYNEYYGGSMSSIVFQTIRESQALAYSTFSSFRSPNKKEDPFMVQAYVGTQADKLHQAIPEMFKLLNEMPEVNKLFENSKDALNNFYQTDRINRAGIFSNYESAKRKGLNHDVRKDIFEKAPNISLADLKKFHEDYISGNKYSLMILGSKENIDLESLSKYGEVVELSLEELFGY